MSVYSGPEVVNSGLVLSLDAGNPRSYPESGTTWTDLSGNLNIGTTTNVTSSSGSMNFNGTDSYVSIDHSTTMDPRRTFTIDIWFKTNQLKGTWTNIINKTNNQHSVSTRTYGIWFHSTGYILFGTGDGSVLDQVSTTAGSVVIGTWYNYCVSVDRTSGTCVTYLNGVIQNNVNTFQKTDSVSTTNSVYIGGRYNYNFFNGSISSVKFYNRALSAAEISQNFNALRGRFSI